jgi:hypothetical protein
MPSVPILLLNGVQRTAPLGGNAAWASSARGRCTPRLPRRVGASPPAARPRNPWPFHEEAGGCCSLSAVCSTAQPDHLVMASSPNSIGPKDGWGRRLTRWFIPLPWSSWVGVDPVPRLLVIWRPVHAKNSDACLGGGWCPKNRTLRGPAPARHRGARLSTLGSGARHPALRKLHIVRVGLVVTHVNADLAAATGLRVVHGRVRDP